jgi:hypothetical protein
MVRAPALCSMCLSFAKTCSRVQIGRVFRQEEQPRASRSNRSANGFVFVAAEIVHHHQITNFERGHQYPLDIDREAFAVDRAVEDPWGFDAVMAQRREKGHGFPMALRNLGFEPLASRGPQAVWSERGTAAAIARSVHRLVNPMRRLTALSVAEPLIRDSPDGSHV